MAGPPKHRFRPLLECLEDRQLPSIAAPTFSDGILSIRGDDAGNRVRVVQRDVSVVVQEFRLGATPSVSREWVFNAANVQRIVFVGKGGNDVFENNTLVPCSAYGGAGNDRLFGGAAGDLLRGGTGNDRLIGRAGDDILRGDADNDFLDGGEGRDFFEDGLGFDRYHDDFDLDHWVADGSTAADIRQGDSGTCTVNSAMAAAALAGVDWQGKISRVSDHHFNVMIRVYGAMRPFDVFFDGTWSDNDSQLTDTTGFTHGDFWTVLVQRGYLQSFGVNWNRPESMWPGGDWKVPEIALEALTNGAISAFYIDFLKDRYTPARLQKVLGEPSAILAWSPYQTEAPIVGNHAYTLTGVFLSSGRWYVRLRNPWGFQHLTLTWAQFTSKFEGLALARPPAGQTL